MAQRRFAVLDRMARYAGPPLARPGSDPQVCRGFWGQRTQLSEVNIMITGKGPRRSRLEGAAAGQPEMPGGRRLSDQAPLRYAAALRAVADCAVSTARLLRRRR